ncbi:hypothetical protein HY839_02300 [Candidatus Azambacteria bacterium]|nr:hypothetical protein [Candidatus Azambacteria bacterium]
MPKQLTKKDVKDAMLSALNPFARAVQLDLLRVNKRFDKVEGGLEEVKSDVAGIKGDVAGIKGDVAGIKGDVAGIKGDVAGIKIRLSGVENDVKWMKDNSSALFTKLDKLISLYEEQKQELLMLGAQFKRLEERVAKLEAGQ